EVAALGHLDRIDLADQVGDGDVRRGELLAVAAVARDPHDLGAVALLGHALAAGLADGRQRVVVDLAAGQGGHRLVEEADQHARHARLGLAALAEEDQVLAAEDGVLDLRDDGVVVADDAGQERLAAPQARDEVVAQLLLDRLALPAAGLELPDGSRTRHQRSGRHYGARAQGCQPLSGARIADVCPAARERTSRPGAPGPPRRARSGGWRRPAGSAAACGGDPGGHRGARRRATSRSRAPGPARRGTATSSRRSRGSAWG